MISKVCIIFIDFGLLCTNAVCTCRWLLTLKTKLKIIPDFESGKVAVIRNVKADLR